MATSDNALLAEDLLLLLLDDEMGRPIVDATKLPRALAGAPLLELALLGPVRLAEYGDDVRKGRLIAVAETDRTADKITAGTLELIRDSRPMKPRRAIAKLTKDLQHARNIPASVYAGRLGCYADRDVKMRRGPRRCVRHHVLVPRRRSRRRVLE